MKDDHIVAEVRRAREELLAECHGDMTELLRRLADREQEHPERLVDLDEFRRRYKQKPDPPDA